MKTFFLTIFSLVCFTFNAQIDDFHGEIIDYLNHNGTRVQYEDAFEGVFPLLKRNFQKFNIPEKQWSLMRSDKEMWIDKLISDLSFAYRAQFKRNEIAKMTEFFKSEPGRKLVNTPESLTKEDNKKVAEFYASDVGKKIIEKREALTKDIETISSEWSRELFGAKMQVLVKEGFVY